MRVQGWGSAVFRSCYTRVYSISPGRPSGLSIFHLGAKGLIGWGRLYGEFGHLPHRAPDRIDEPLVLRGGQAAERLGLLKNGVVHRRVHEGHFIAEVARLFFFFGGGEEGIRSAA